MNEKQNYDCVERFDSSTSALKYLNDKYGSDELTIDPLMVISINKGYKTLNTLNSSAGFLMMLASPFPSDLNNLKKLNDIFFDSSSEEINKWYSFFDHPNSDDMGRFDIQAKINNFDMNYNREIPRNDGSNSGRKYLMDNHNVLDHECTPMVLKNPFYNGGVKTLNDLGIQDATPHLNIRVEGQTLASYLRDGLNK